MNENKIEIRNLSKAFGKKVVLDGIDLDVKRGESLVVIGGSGTGKSVLIKCIQGLLNADSGSIKIDEEEEQAFKKMFVRYKKEIVRLGLEDDNFDSDINPLETTGAYLSPKEFKDALLDEDTVVLDTRNDYEYDLGHFRGAIRPDIRNFREMPQ